MKTPLERAARALCTLAGNPENTMFESKPMWVSYAPQALAVIEAIREPSEEMLREVVVQTDDIERHFPLAERALAGMPKPSPERQRDGLIALAELTRDWQAMIDAILAQLPEGKS